MSTKVEDILTILKTFGGFSDFQSDDIWWRTDEKYAPVTFFVNCNDLFVWGCGDCEEITVADLPDLLKALEDSKDEKGRASHAELLWVARKRGFRPQVAFYKYFSDREKELFDACGSAEEQYGNPKSE